MWFSAHLRPMVSCCILFPQEAGLAWAKRQSILREQIIASKQDTPSRSSSPAPAPVSNNWWSFSWDNPLVDRAGASGAAR